MANSAGIVSNTDVISNLERVWSDSRKCEELTCVLREITQLTKHEAFRQSLTQATWNNYFKVLSYALDLIQSPRNTAEELDFIIELFRCLRNSCVGCYKDEQFVVNNKDIFDIGIQILLHLVKCRTNKCEKEILVLRCCLQLFGNFVCQHNLCKAIIWKHFKDEYLFRYLFQHDDLKVQEYSMMILYNCMIPEAVDYIVNDNNGLEILKAVLDRLYQNVIDWGILFLELFINEGVFMDKCYCMLPTQSRLLVLDMYAQVIDGTDSIVPDATVAFIKNLFIKCAIDIVKAYNTTYSINTDSLDAVEVVKLLSLLCSASVADPYSRTLKSCPELLETAVDTLKSVHLLGKSSCNAFSALSNLKEVTSVPKEEIELHPSFGFKKNLIRLIGNLCSGFKPNQDLVRKLDGIPLLLDCCNLDARNPFIMQWCILAIRNLLENNPDNQAVVASVTVTGELANSSLLHELGLKVEMLDSQPVLKKLVNEI